MITRGYFALLYTSRSFQPHLNLYTTPNVNPNATSLAGIRCKSKKAKAKTKSIQEPKFDLVLDTAIMETSGLDKLRDSLSVSMSYFKNEIINKLTYNITPKHLDSIQVQTDTGYTPLKLLSQINIPKPNILRLDMTHSKQYIESALKAIQKSLPFLGVQMDGISSIDVLVPKVNKEIDEKLIKETKKRGEEYKLQINTKSNQVLKLLKCEKSLSKEDIFGAEDYIRALVNYFVNEIEQSVKLKIQEIDP